ncbi:hypothetical protein [Rhodobium gokarnense]|uniref:Uncharacterized protein n=1 Tax=Rhodobium gokarnense TaxID=364296 RepID=A0ABT3H859_9HYPH|nr:hypothetical protein [Rhodobium gokarnense]MCW2306587.1 hypothetical protein [Rhodobium gokarnense]
MPPELHPAAIDHLPHFIPTADGGDYLFTVMIVFLVVMVLIVGNIYLWLHSLPERLAHGAGRTQFEIVAILALLALFTHNNLFWVAALLLAFLRVPDVVTPLLSMARSLRRMAGPRDHDEKVSAEDRDTGKASAEPPAGAAAPQSATPPQPEQA